MLVKSNITSTTYFSYIDFLKLQVSSGFCPGDFCIGRLSENSLQRKSITTSSFRTVSRRCRMKYRHEWKYPISETDHIVIRQRVGAVMQPDSHAKDGKYHIRSLYFDTAGDKALREKTDGFNRREKFRIRFYNLDTSVIHLEKKARLTVLGQSFQTAFLLQRRNPLLTESFHGWRNVGGLLCRSFTRRCWGRGFDRKR